MKRARDIGKTVLTLGFLAAVLLSGCMPIASGSSGTEPIDPVPQKSFAEVTLYFGDDQAMEVLPEFRVVEVPSDPAQRLPLEKLAVLELLKGPKDPTLRKTLPPEARLLSLEIADGTVMVNFSKEVQTKHWGGSAGEGMTLLSLVNTMTDFEGVTRVQILVEGQTVETLAGHFDTSQPLTRSLRTGPVFTSPERAKDLQARADKGQEEWRKDPLQVAKKEAPARGFPPGDRLSVSSSPSRHGPEGTAFVTATADGKTYLILLVQPEKKGEAGVWVIDHIAEAE